MNVYCPSTQFMTFINRNVSTFKHAKNTCRNFVIMLEEVDRSALVLPVCRQAWGVSIPLWGQALPCVCLMTFSVPLHLVANLQITLSVSWSPPSPSFQTSKLLGIDSKRWKLFRAIKEAGVISNKDTNEGCSKYYKIVEQDIIMF